MSAYQRKTHRRLEFTAYLHAKKLRYAVPSQETVTIGRSGDCDISLRHPSVSRRHARLHIGDELMVEDLASRNGTFLFRASTSPDPDRDETLNSARDRKFEPSRLYAIEPGDMLRVGSVMLRLSEEAATSVMILPEVDDESDELVFADERTRDVLAMAAKVAKGDISLLILGETGVGKDVFARYVHRCSRRSKGPFVRVNCAALSHNLLESELFGHKKGAFTGALDDKEGLLESANRGTVFLDEIGEMPLSTQVKLLNVLETGEVVRVGSTRPRKIDIRFVAATNRNLADEVQAGRFRKDLYFRVNGIHLEIPPLRERQGDIEPLARLFLRKFCGLSGIAVPEFSADAIERLHEYPWPGNVRELRNAMERAPLLCGGGPIAPEHLPTDETTARLLFDFDDFEDRTLVSSPRRPASTPDSERFRIVSALEQCGGNQTRAAKVLGISRRTLVNRLNQFELPRPRKPAGG